jgi:hypothetical protein
MRAFETQSGFPSLNKIFYKMPFFVIFYLLLNITGCVSTQNDSVDAVTLLDGAWEHNDFILVIRQNYYVSYYNKVFYGAGTVKYDDVSFTLVSSLARDGDDIIEFEETVNGKYRVTGDMLTISNIKGRYRSLNGNWERIKDVNPEDFIEIRNDDQTII